MRLIYPLARSRKTRHEGQVPFGAIAQRRHEGQVPFGAAAQTVPGSQTPFDTAARRPGGSRGPSAPDGALSRSHGGTAARGRRFTAPPGLRGRPRRAGVKAGRLRRPTLPRAARSFLDAYRPRTFLMVNTGLTHRQEVGLLRSPHPPGDAAGERRHPAGSWAKPTKVSGTHIYVAHPAQHFAPRKPRIHAILRGIPRGITARGATWNPS